MFENSGKELELYYVKGEAVSLWVPLCIALLGVINSIIIAQSLLFSDFKIQDLLSWPTKVRNQYVQEAERSTGDGSTELSEGKAEEGTFEGTGQSEIIAFKPTVTNEKNETIPAWPGEIVPGKISGTVNGLSESPQFGDGDEFAGLPEVQKLSNEAVTNISSPDGEPESSLMQDCPPLFFFAFPKGSETSNVQNLMPKIKRLDSWLKKNPEAKVFIEGHADSSGPEEFNLLLSYRRAKAAKKILIEAGISKSQLITRAFGEHEPLQGQLAQSKKNRRASIRVDALLECNNTLINGDSN